VKSSWKIKGVYLEVVHINFHTNTTLLYDSATIFLQSPVVHTGFFLVREFGPEFFRGGVQQNQLRTEGRENGDMEAVAP
jgi:hypothetical protein